MEGNKLILQLAALDTAKLAIIAIGFTGFFYWMFILDESTALGNRYAAAQAEISAETAKQIESQKAIAKADEVKKQLETVGEEYQKITAQIPSELQGADVIRSVQGIALLSGINIRLTEPKPPVQKEMLDEIPFKLVLEGTFSEVTNFLYNIATAERMMRIGDFSLVTSSSSSSSNVSFEGQIMAYRFRKN